MIVMAKDKGGAHAKGRGGRHAQKGGKEAREMLKQAKKSGNKDLEKQIRNALKGADVVIQPNVAKGWKAILTKIDRSQARPPKRNWLGGGEGRGPKGDE